jgi:hypothetical protein
MVFPKARQRDQNAAGVVCCSARNSFSSEGVISTPEAAAGLRAGDAHGEDAERQLEYFARSADDDVRERSHRRSISRNQDHPGSVKGEVRGPKHRGNLSVASSLVRGTAIACGIAAVAGLGSGIAVGKPVQPEDVQSARLLPADLCARLGDISTLLPKATTNQKKQLTQTGSTEITCAVDVPEQTQPTSSAASLTIRITPYSGREAGPDQPPFTPAEIAKQAFARKPWPTVKDRPYPTKVDKYAGTDWDSRVAVLVYRADLTVQVDYAAHPIDLATAQQAAQVIADRAIWESK